MIINDLSAAAPKFIPWAMAGGATRRVYPLGLMPCRTRVLKSSAPAPREISKVRKKYVYLIIIVLCVELKRLTEVKSLRLGHSGGPVKFQQQPTGNVMYFFLFVCDDVRFIREPDNIS
jgi:hypothetical protein